MNWIENAFAFLVKGGPVMIPLMACSILSLTIMIERYFKLKGANADTSDLARQVEDSLYSGQMNTAVEQCESSNTPAGRVMVAGILGRKLGVHQVQRMMEEKAISETGELQSRLGVLDTIITIAPLLGLLGTVTGMIRSFHVMSTKSGMSTPMAITGGVAEALIATATGLAIAIATVVGYNYLNEQVKHSVESMEIRATQLLTIVADIEDRRNEIKTISA